MPTKVSGRVPPASPRRQAGLSKLVLIVVIILGLLLIGGGTVAALYFSGVVGGGQEAAAEADAQDGAEQEAEPKPALYLPLEPPIVVNFSGEQRSGYLQVGVELMARDQAVLDAVKTHMPVVRNNLILLFGDQNYSTLKSRTGKEQLRQRAREAVNEVLASRGVEGQVEAVYFTSFILQ